MTETALNEKIAKLTENELSEAHLRSNGRRRLRRVRDIQKSDRLLHIINYGVLLLLILMFQRKQKNGYLLLQRKTTRNT